jgi:hypothetical protein
MTETDTEPDPQHHVTADETADPLDTDPAAATGDADQAERGELPAEIPGAGQE